MTNESRAVALRPETGLFPDAQTWQTIGQMAELFYRSGMLPPAIKSAQAAVFAIQKGRELGVPPTAALTSIQVIQGRPTCSAELMLALVQRDYGANAMRITATDNTRCTITYRHPDVAETQTYSWTIEDANRAGLVTGNPAWNKYPAAMLRARCISAVARMAFPLSILGMYTPEEMGAAVAVRDDGEIVVTEFAAEPTPLRVVDQTTGEVTVLPDRQPPAPARVKGFAWHVDRSWPGETCQAIATVNGTRCDKPGTLTTDERAAGCRLCEKHAGQLAANPVGPLRVTGEALPPPELPAFTPPADFLGEDESRQAF